MHLMNKHCHRATVHSCHNWGDGVMLRQAREPRRIDIQGRVRRVTYPIYGRTEEGDGRKSEGRRRSATRRHRDNPRHRAREKHERSEGRVFFSQSAVTGATGAPGRKDMVITRAMIRHVLIADGRHVDEGLRAQDAHATVAKPRRRRTGHIAEVDDGERRGLAAAMGALDGVEVSHKTSAIGLGDDACR